MNYRLLSAIFAASALTAFAAYEINFPADTTIDTTSGTPPRHLDAIALTSPEFGEQSATVGQETDKLLFHDLTATARFKARAGETLTASLDWPGVWMCGYLYIDLDKDGTFNPATELITYSNLDNVNALGAQVANTVMSAPSTCVAMPSFVLPASLPAGEYRMRYVVDWNAAEPGGRTGSSNSIVDNRGAIADATLVVEPAAAPATPYATAYGADAVITHKDRRLANIRFAPEGLAAQTLAVGQDADLKLIHDCTDKVLIARAGTRMAITYGWTGTWMSSYIYIDRDNDGAFNFAIDPATGRPLPGSDIMSYSHYGSLNSAGSTATGQNVTPPVFTLPASLAPGTYRMRVKIDWDEIDPAGRSTEANNILSNGGAITDLTIMIVDSGSDHAIKASAQNGSITLADGTDANGAAMPASGPLSLTATPAEGYRFDGFRISKGISLPEGKTLIAPELSGDITIPAWATDNGTITLAAEQFIGDAEIEACFIALADAPAGGRYESHYASQQLDPATGFSAVSANGESIDIAAQTAHSFTDAALNAARNSVLELSAEYSGSASEFNLMIDMDQDGEFFRNPAMITNELLATEASPSFSIALPESLPAGVYRARIEAAGQCDTEFLINVYNPTSSLRTKALNSILLASDDSPLGETISAFTDLTVKAKASVPGFEADSVIVRHGQNLSGPEFICGNRQWADSKVRILKTKLASIPAEIVNGDVEIYALFNETANSEWTKVWGDEFNDGTLSTERWKYHPRYGSTWNRFIAQGAEQQKLVNTFEDGYYNSHAIATPAQFTEETQPMITGAIYSNGLFDMTYGHVEARVKTTPHTGNFPAFWMMPSGPAPEIVELGLSGWPNNGEIDIWEQIDAQGASHHTVHSGWTGWSIYNKWPEAPKQSSPASTKQNNLDANLWHVYAITWDDESIQWLVDGKVVFTYSNQHYSEPDSKYYSSERLTWPFDKNFYIILNQSVGNGGWAKNPDTSFHYRTLFDYVRVYQKKDGSQSNVSKLKGNGDDPDFYVPATGSTDFNDPTPDSIENITAEPAAGSARREIFDLNGRRLGSAAPAPGLYIEKIGSQTRKIIVR